MAAAALGFDPCKALAALARPNAAAAIWRSFPERERETTSLARFGFCVTAASIAADIAGPPPGYCAKIAPMDIPWAREEPAKNDVPTRTANAIRAPRMRNM